MVEVGIGWVKGGGRGKGLFYGCVWRFCLIKGCVYLEALRKKELTAYQPHPAPSSDQKIQ